MQPAVTLVGGGSWPTVSRDEMPTLMGRRADRTSVALVVGALMAKEQGWRIGADEAAGGQLIAAPVLASAGHHGHSSPRGDGRDNLIPIQDGTHGEKGQNGCGIGAEGDPSYTLDTTGAQSVGVRRLTPLECERLQGFPDGWTCLCGEGHRGSIHCTCPDTPRYKMLGNAVSVPVAQWIAERLKATA